MASQTRGRLDRVAACGCRSYRRCYCLWMQSGKGSIRRLSDAVMVVTPHIQTYALLIHFLCLLLVASLFTVMNRIQNVCSFVSSFTLTYIDGTATRFRPCACIYSAHVSPRLFNNDLSRFHHVRFLRAISVPKAWMSAEWAPMLVPVGTSTCVT